MLGFLISPWRFAIVVVAAYLALALPPLAAHRFDLSAFIVAGDRYVDPALTPGLILVHPRSAGYDGQFFYRLALDPWQFEETAFGVRLDKPAFRMSRILYPVLAWLASLGVAKLVPAALFGVNLAALGLVAAASVSLSKAARLPAALPVAIVMWPGFLVSLMHDTAEILSCGLMLAAILCRVRGRLVLYAAVAAAATLTRETTVPVFAGILAWDAVAAWRGHGGRNAAAAGAVLFLPFLLWRLALGLIWHVAPDSHGISQNLGALPFAGWAETLFASMSGSRHWAVAPMKDLFVRSVVLVTAAGLAVFYVCTASRIGRLRHGDSSLRPLAVSWVLLAVMIAFLKASGPWVEPAGYLRAFTECYVVGCLVLGASSFAVARRNVAVGGGAVFVLVWIYCVSQIGLHGIS